MTKNSGNKFNVLSWDTEFFGFKIAKVIAFENADELKKDLKNNAIKLAYVETSEKVPTLGEPIVTKRTYIKTSVPHNESRTIKYESGPNDHQMMDLALQTGVYSRFKLDPGFKKEQYEGLYLQWMRGCLAKELANDTFICQGPEGIDGFVAVKYFNDFASIVLIGTHHRARGQGLASLLIQRTENEAIQRKLPHVRVVTQGENAVACRFYEKNGFTVEQDVFIYHLWL